MEILERRFYARDALEVAKELLGMYLVHNSAKGQMVGKIVEVEAYRGRGDPASHAYKGLTKRNRILFEGPGFAYIYFVYGNHYCFNVTTNDRGVVLLRSIEPIKGIEIMRDRKRDENLVSLANGPGKLTRAMKITKEHYGTDLTDGKRLFICNPEANESLGVVVSRRIGINVAVERPWRFYIEASDFVSRK